MKQYVRYIHTNKAYTNLSSKLKKLVDEKILEKRYPLDDEEKLEVEIYAGKQVVLTIKHLDEIKEINFLIGNNDSYSELLKTVGMHN